MIRVEDAKMTCLRTLEEYNVCAAYFIIKCLDELLKNNDVIQSTSGEKQDGLINRVVFLLPVFLQAHYSTGRVSASFTSTAMAPATVHEAGGQPEPPRPSPRTSPCTRA